MNINVNKLEAKVINNLCFKLITFSSSYGTRSLRNISQK